jgi:hypothetical protein
MLTLMRLIVNVLRTVGSVPDLWNSLSRLFRQVESLSHFPKIRQVRRGLHYAAPGYDR